MMILKYLSLLCVCGAFFASAPVLLAELPEASVYDEKTEKFYPYKARTLDDVEGYQERPENLEFSRYGGWKAKRVKATGFFRVEKIEGRWWVIDPEGYLYIHKAVNSVQLFKGYSPDNVYETLPGFGFNGTGNWSDIEIQDSRLKKSTPLAYCPKYSFVSSYKHKRKDKLPIAVFDDAFVDFCERKAKFFAQFKNDPHVFGYFIDNELSWTFTGGLESHLGVKDPKDKNYLAAVKFLSSRNKGVKDFTDDDADDYAALMLERYLTVVCAAVRKVDPNHMILGPRFNKNWNRSKEFMETAGRHLDIVALNHYHRWGTRNNELENIAIWSKKPLLMSEFYAMEKIPNFEEKGAGWRVEDEYSRSLFYENFLTKQLEKPFVVGFHWFNFQDDFKDGSLTEAKAKRGIIDIKAKEYLKLKQSMRHVNDRIYDYIDYVDSRAKPDVTLPAEADAYFQGDKNVGAGPELLVRSASKKYARTVYLRFDPASINGKKIVSAKIQLFGTSLEEKLTGNYHAALVKNKSWKENDITLDNAPTGSTVLATWNHGDDIEIDVTKELISAIKNRDKLSIKVYDTLANKLEVTYGSREHPNTYAQPKLVVYYKK